MRTIERTSRFKRDYRRASRGRHRNDLDERLAVVVNTLAHDIPLDERHHDHALKGPWRDFRDCHLWPGLVLIDEKPDAGTHICPASSSGIGGAAEGRSGESTTSPLVGE